MDTFFEQIVAIKKTGKTVLTVILIWLGALVLSGLTFFIPFIRNFALLAILGIGYGAFKLSSTFNIEYEYIITNGIMDVDKIINKSSRKRVLSFDLTGATRLEKYNPALLNNINPKSVNFICNETDPNAYFMVIDGDKESSYIVFAPDERLQSAIVKYVPKFVSNSAFK